MMGMKKMQEKRIYLDIRLSEYHRTVGGHDEWWSSKKTNGRVKTRQDPVLGQKENDIKRVDRV